MTLSVVTGLALIFLLPRVIIASVMEFSSLFGNARIRNGNNKKTLMMRSGGGRVKPALKAPHAKSQRRKGHAIKLPGGDYDTLRGRKS